MTDAQRQLAEVLRRAVENPRSISQADLGVALATEAADGPRAPGPLPGAGAERRRSGRMGVNIGGLIRPAGLAAGRARSALLTDVGPGGAKLRLLCPAPARGPVILRLDGPANALPAEFPGRVTWLEPELWGVRAGLEIADGSCYAWFAALRALAQREMIAVSPRG